MRDRLEAHILVRTCYKLTNSKNRTQRPRNKTLLSQTSSENSSSKEPICSFCLERSTATLFKGTFCSDVMF